MQPADAALFKPLKQNGKNTVYECKRTNNNKSVLSYLLEKAMDGVSSETVQNGFRKCGLYPFDSNAIDFRKCMFDNTRKVDTIEDPRLKVKPTNFKVEHLLLFRIHYAAWQNSTVQTNTNREKWRIGRRYRG